MAFPRDEGTGEAVLFMLLVGVVIQAVRQTVRDLETVGFGPWELGFFLLIALVVYGTVRVAMKK